jgi:hypothetical protein
MTKKLRNRKFYENIGIDLDKFIEISKDEIMEYVSSMVWDDPKYYLGKDDYTDKEVYEFIDNDVNFYTKSIKSFMRDYDIDEASFFNKDKFKTMIDICNIHNKKSKDHNCDFLNT